MVILESILLLPQLFYSDLPEFTINPPFSIANAYCTVPQKYWLAVN